MRTIIHWDNVPREVVNSPRIRFFKICLDRLLPSCLDHVFARRIRTRWCMRSFPIWYSIILWKKYWGTFLMTLDILLKLLISKSPLTAFETYIPSWYYYAYIHSSEFSVYSQKITHFFKFIWLPEDIWDSISHLRHWNRWLSDMMWSVGKPGTSAAAVRGQVTLKGS